MDSELNKIPFITILICIVCIFVYWNQYRTDGRYYDAINSFCNQSIERGDLILIRKISHKQSGNQCEQLFDSIRRAPVPENKLTELVMQSEPIGSFANDEDDFYYRMSRLKELYNAYEIKVPRHLTAELAYDPKQMDIVKMVTSTFSHGDLLHLFGNLLFFYIFSSSVELLFGSLLYSGFILVATLGTSIAYSYAMIGVEEVMPTIGLSGVVMASVAALAAMLPSAKIRCFFWFLFFYKIFRIPALLLAVWYVGWDIYEMHLYGNNSYINYVAHVSGAAIGAVLGIIFFLFRKEHIRASVAV
ncbi:MAG: rhomboid family intramembrane serine protease [Candidatus Thiodiazotropha sp.]